MFAEKLQDLTNYSFLKNAFWFASFFKFTVTYEVLCLLVLFLLFMPTSVLRYNLVITHQNASTNILQFNSFICLATCNVSLKPRHMCVLILVKILILSSFYHRPSFPAQPPPTQPITPTSEKQMQALHRGPNAWSLGEPKWQIPCTALCEWQWFIESATFNCQDPSRSFLQNIIYSSVELSHFMGNRSLTPNLSSYKKNPGLHSLAPAKSVLCGRFPFACGDFLELVY